MRHMSFIQRLAFAPAAITLAIGAFAPTGPASAVVIQGFESGLGGVLVFGDASTTGRYGPGVGGVFPTEGSSQLLLTTFSSSADGSNISGTSALLRANLATATGIAAAALRN